MNSLINKFLPSIVAGIIVIAFAIIIRVPQTIFVGGGLLVLLVAVAVWQLTNRQLLKLRFWNFVVTPVLLTAAGLTCYAFLEDRRLQMGLTILIGMFVWLFLEIVYFYIHDRPHYQPHALENISNHLNVLAVFFSVSGSLSSSIFLGLSPWIFVPIIALVSLLACYQSCWASELPFRQVYRYVLVVSLLMVEAFIVATLAPTSVYVGGVMVTIVYYCCIGIARNWLHGITEFTVARRYIGIGLTVLTLVLLSAKWL